MRNLLDQYNQLSPDFKVVLKVLAFAMTPIRYESFYSWVASEGPIETTEIHLTKGRIKEILHRLVKGNVVLESKAYGSSDALFLEPAFQSLILAREVKAGDPLFVFLAQKARKVLWQDVFRSERELLFLRDMVFLTQSLLVYGPDEFVREASSVWDRWDQGIGDPLSPHNFFFVGAFLVRLPPKPPEVVVKLSLMLLDQLFQASFLYLWADSTDWIEAVLKTSENPELLAKAREGLFLLWFLKGNFQSILESQEKDLQPLARSAQALAFFYTGDEEKGKLLIDDILQDQSTDPKSSERQFLDNPFFVFQAIWYISRGWASELKLPSWALGHEGDLVRDSALLVRALFRHRGNSEPIEGFLRDVGKTRHNGIIQHWLIEMGLRWFSPQGISIPELSLQNLEAMYSFAEKNGFKTLQWEGARLLAQASPNSVWTRKAENLRREIGVVTSMADQYNKADKWTDQLERLKGLRLAKKNQGADDEPAEILGWLFDPSKLEITPCLRKRLKSGSWAVPRPLAVSTVMKKEHTAIKPQDLAIIKTAQYQSTYLIRFDPKLALPALVGHPYVFLADSPEVHVEVIGKEIELTVTENKDALVFGFSFNPFSELPLVEQTGISSWTVTHPSPELRKVADVIGETLSVPIAAKKEVLEILGRLTASIKIDSPLVGEHSKAVNLAPDPRPVIFLYPVGVGLRAEVHVKPLGFGGPCLRTAEGPHSIYATIDKELRCTKRVFQSEKNSLQAVLDTCPTLAAWLAETNSALIEEPTSCLEVLSELRDAGESVSVEWPKGGRIKVRAPLKFDFAHLSLSKVQNWFEVSGKFDAGGGTILSLAEVLSKADSAQGRFIELQEGDFIEIETQFLKQLEQLARTMDLHGKSVRLHPMGLLSSELLKNTEVVRSADKESEDFRRSIAQVFRTESPLPANLTAELRPYQQEGFQWLRRLSDLGAGACLADDMGLGKTLQCIALLAHKAAGGPSLVVAPASVSGNWILEINRFCSDLEPVLFGFGDKAGRASQIEGLRSHQVLVTTYGKLVSEEELFASRRWNVVVLDEAHAIKNIQARRSRSVLGLNADFRIAATGTPVQNHLEELWSLFEFLNPGLLGSRESFGKKYLVEENEGAGSIRKSLRDIIKPFLLRRTKNQVLMDLPEKTETTLSLELSLEERGWYEALRQKALKEFKRLAGKKPGEKQMLVLVELMKLRRACCHPSMAGGPELPVTSKLSALEELLVTMRENGHRALIFSQFTDHLALIRALVERMGMGYEYLDGSTPVKNRSSIVERFQSGEAPVFLISLQAGGTGLNLTSADYVIHMDPWWNPAVEDQASDRVHRIGQTRPVTIYRFVAKDTIEEKIVELHRSKRDLADALLEGAEAAARLTPEDLMALVSQGGLPSDSHETD